MDIQQPLHILQREIVSLPEASNNPSMKNTKGGADEKYLIPAATGLRLRICCSRQETFSIFNSATCKRLTAGHRWQTLHCEPIMPFVSPPVSSSD